MKTESRNAKLVLASSSPRRAELLRNAGIPFTLCPVDVAEERRQQEWPEDFVRRIAGEKAEAAFARHPDKFVLAADTVVIVDGQVLGKPSDAQDAGRMLRLLSAGSHLVTTGVCLLGPGVEDTRAETTTVSFSPLSDAEIAEYVSTGEPMDKAGAYAVQGIASRWVTHLDGCYFNVMGLPVPLVYRMLREHGAL
ncbi:MAG TPA: Maf family protein [Terriglobales bacterium]|nr:Maf family protein [Terriglobales bacterium]